MRQIYKHFLQLFGWKTILSVEIPPKCIVCVAPHTSNWDFLIGRLYYSSIGGKLNFLMKKEWFFFPLGFFLKAIGGIPVDRKRKGKNKISLTQQMIDEFSKRKIFQLAIAPEGTRKKTSKWKTGFYNMAIGANVPISLAYIDYARKEVGVSKIFNPTGNEEADIQQIKNFFKDFKGKFPEKFSI